MADLYGIGISAILANQYGLEVTSQNMANVNTPGYSRQIPLFSSRDLGSHPAGITVQGRQRMADAYINLDLRNAISSSYQMNTYFQNAERLDNLFSNKVSDLSINMQDFFAGLQDLNNDPASNQNREVFFNQMLMMVDRFKSMSNELDGQFFDFAASVDSVLGEINTLLNNIAEANHRLSGNGGNVTALLDQRDGLLEELSKYVYFTVNEKDDGQVDINIGKGNSLILGAQAASLRIDISQGDFMQFDIKLRSELEDISIQDVIDGGTLGGLLQYKDEILSLAHGEIGRLAMTLGDAINKQNQLGMDLNSELGVALFNDINDPAAMSRRVIDDAGNTGSGVVTIGIDDISKVTSSNYQLRISGTDCVILRQSDNSIITTTPIGTIPNTIQLEGLNINLDSGTFNDGDKYLLTPTRYGANELSLMVKDVNKLALASPIRVITNSTNTGDVSIVETSVNDTSNSSFSVPGDLNPPIRIEFLSPNSYQIVNASTSGVIEGPITYNPSVENLVFPTPGAFDPGYQINLAGIANTGDEFTIEYNSDGTSDNRNGFVMTQLQTARLLNDGATTMQQAYQQFANRVATKTHFADIGAQTASIVQSQAQARRDNFSGVNIDEETANMIRYQQAYTAAAHLLSVARTTFDMLLNAIDR